MKRRVALVTHSFEGGGGVTTMARFLHRVLQESDTFEPTVFSLAISSRDSASVRLLNPASWLRGSECRAVEVGGIRYHHVGAFGAEFEFMRYRPRAALTELLRTFDLVQFVVGSPPWMCAAADVARPRFLWAATLTRADRASRLREASWPRRFWMELMTRAAERMECRGVRLADEIFALSPYSVENLRRLAEGRPVTLALCGVDTNHYQPGPAEGSPAWICVGRLDDPRKNIRLLIEAYARLVSRLPAAPELRLVGPHPGPAIVQLVEDRGLADRVRFLGSKTQAELPQLYRNALGFVLSSDEEGLGIVIQEAMAAGLPVVSTACGGPEILVEPDVTGLLVPPGDAAALAQALEALTVDQARRKRMAAAARRSAVERFGLDAGGVFLRAYERALSCGPESKSTAPVPSSPVRA